MGFTDPLGLNPAVLVPIGIGFLGMSICQADPNCRQKVQKLVRQCVDSTDRLKNWIFNDGVGTPAEEIKPN